jgi:ADP-ribose pyrophosphatase YjhB (NUDIX family)
MPEIMNPAQQIALWSDRLRDVSAMGLLFAKSVHDEIAYREVQSIAMEMLSLATDLPPEEIEPLRGTVFVRPTPLATGDAAVIDDDGRMLLIRRSDNGQWAMPGGALDVGETPAEGVQREALEETGVHCRAVSLVGAFDSRLCGSQTPHHLYHFVFLCRPLETEPVSEPSHSFEVLEVGWFAEADLPEEIDPGHVSRIPEAFRVWRGDREPFFDRGPSTSG